MKIRRLVMARRRGAVAVVAAALVATAALPLGAVATSVPEPEPTASPPPMAVETSVPESAPTASSVRDWNQHAVAVLMTPSDAPEPGAGQTPPVTMLHMAMVHGAIYDAVNAIEGGYQPLLPGLPAASPSASLDAAVATAAHDVLVGLGTDPPMPEAVVTRIDGLYEEALAAIPDGTDKTDGIAVGAAAAAAMLAARADDGRYVPFSHPVGDQPGEWRPAPPDEISDPFAWVANVQPFTLDSSSQFRSSGPPALDSAEYTTEYNEVKDLGAVDGARSPEQQAIAEFHVNTVEMYNRTLRTVAEAEGLTLAEDARLLAMANVAGADTAINCWDDKAYWHFWRPITAIHEGDNDGNDDTVGDPSWEPMAPDTPVSGQRFWLQLPHGGVHAQRRRLLRRGADRLQPREDRARRPRGDPRVCDVHGRSPRDHRRPRVPGPPLPHRRRAGRRDRHQRRRVGRHQLLPTGERGEHGERAAHHLSPPVLPPRVRRFCLTRGGGMRGQKSGAPPFLSR